MEDSGTEVEDRPQPEGNDITDNASEDPENEDKEITNPTDNVNKFKVVGLVGQGSV